MVNMQMLRAKLKVLDVSYGTGTGRSFQYAFLKCDSFICTEGFPSQFLEYKFGL